MKLVTIVNLGLVILFGFLVAGCGNSQSNQSLNLKKGARFKDTVSVSMPSVSWYSKPILHFQVPVGWTRHKLTDGHGGMGGYVWTDPRYPNQVIGVSSLGLVVKKTDQNPADLLKSFISGIKITEDKPNQVAGIFVNTSKFNPFTKESTPYIGYGKEYKILKPHSLSVMVEIWGTKKLVNTVLPTIQVC